MRDRHRLHCLQRPQLPQFKFMAQLGVSLQATEMSFSVRNDTENLEYNGHNLNTLFAQRINLSDPNLSAW